MPWTLSVNRPTSIVILTSSGKSRLSAAFQASVEANPLRPGDAPQTFQQYWERGFDVASVSWGPIVMPLVVGSRHWFTFSFVAASSLSARCGSNG